MRRRELLVGAAAIVAGPSLAQPSLRRLGIMQALPEADADIQARLALFRQALAAQGWSEDRNLRTFSRFGAGFADGAAAILAEQPDVVFAASTPVLRALRAATQTVPIIFANVSDPVGDGFVESLGRPGGNMTGFSNYEPGLGPKWVALLREIAPQTARVSILFNPDTAPHALFLPPLIAGAAALSIGCEPRPVRSPAEIEGALGALGGEAGRGLVMLPDTFIGTHRGLITSLAARHRLPAVFPFGYHARDGGLLAYGADQADQFRRAPAYIDRILRGESPATLPVQAPVAFEMVVNLRAARDLGLTVPSTLLARADEVIE